MLFTGNHAFVNHVYLQISKFQPQTSTHQPLLVKMSKSDVSVPSNDTGVEQQGTPAGGAVQRRIPVASSHVRVSFGALPYSRNIDVLPRWKTCGKPPIGGQLRLI